MNFLISKLCGNQNIFTEFAGQKNLEFLCMCVILQFLYLFDRRYGFECYVTDLFDAPKSVLQFLCERYHLHNIPVGTAETEKMSTKVCSRDMLSLNVYQCSPLFQCFPEYCCMQVLKWKETLIRIRLLISCEGHFYLSRYNWVSKSKILSMTVKAKSLSNNKYL